MTAKRVTITNVTDKPSRLLTQRRLANVPIQVGGERIAPGASARVRERDLAHPHIARLFRASALVYGERAASASGDTAPAPPPGKPMETPSAEAASPESGDDNHRMTRAERRAEAKLRQQATAEPAREDDHESEPVTGQRPGDG